MKRSRGRGRKSTNFNNRTLDSSGPDVKIRGTASHIFEKYQALARDANSSGDRIVAENLLQHAEHYFRIMKTFQANNAATAGANANGGAAGSETRTGQSTNGKTGAGHKAGDVVANDGATVVEIEPKTSGRREGRHPADGKVLKSAGDGDKCESSDGSKPVTEEALP